MEIKFFSAGKIMDLSGQKVSVSESNSKVSDKISTKYLFPFEFYMDEEFKKTFGDYSSYDSYNLPKMIDGQLLYENIYRIAKLEILSTQGDYLTGQIDFGFEDVPNFDKPLKDLPLEKFPVDDIHIFAAEVTKKKYPQTNFNFPRLYNAQFSPEDELWDAYNGYYNDLNVAGTEMLRNYITEDGIIYNQNIIHPMPHLLYLLKAGFKDAGSNLEGDILTDETLSDIFVFSGTEYFSRLTLRKLGMIIYPRDYDHLRFSSNPIRAIYDVSLSIPKSGNYRLISKMNLFDELCFLRIYLDGADIYYRKGKGRGLVAEMDITTTKENAVLRIVGEMPYYYRGVQDPFCEVNIVAKDPYANEDDAPGEDNGVITNMNEIDLARAVPDITFGEFVNRIRNYLNYDVEPRGNSIVMNKLVNSKPIDIKTIPEWHLEKEPLRNILNKKSFLLKSPVWENEEKADSVFFDNSGITINKNENEETSVIESNAYVLPVYVAKPQGPMTAVVKSYSSNLLQLVKYDGRIGVQNNAKPAPELTFPTLFFTNWEKWLRGRLNSFEYEWSFTAEDDELNFTIKDFISCYQNIHIVKEWVKDYSENSVQISIKTETVN